MSKSQTEGDNQSLEHKKNILQKTLQRCKGAFIYAFIFSFAINVLILSMPIFSLQVLDRVISSGSSDTLLVLSVLAVASFIALAILQGAKSTIFSNISRFLDEVVSKQVFKLSIITSAKKVSVNSSQDLRDLQVIKSFITGGSIHAIFDAPWSLIFLAAIFCINPTIGIVTTFGCLLLLVLAYINEQSVKRPLFAASENLIKSMNYIEIANRNAEAIEGMGMENNVILNWQKTNNKVISMQYKASRRSAIITAISKFMRLFIQMSIIALGAYFVMIDQISIGGVIANSILIGRAMIPFDSAIKTWHGIVLTRRSYDSLKKRLDHMPQHSNTMTYNPPEGNLYIENVTFAYEGASSPLISELNIKVQQGEVIGIMGHSGSGKTTLAKIIIGLIKPTSGVVRLDHADIAMWNRTDLGQYIGYLPQDIELFNGTVKENIARMNKLANSEDIIRAANMSRVHNMILHLPNGYETRIGIGGSILSSGQRQRLGLARAFYGTPKLLMLDEPNSNLDHDGEINLSESIQNAKHNKITTIIISHRQSIIAEMDKILYLGDNGSYIFGNRDLVLKRIYASRSQNLEKIRV